MEKRQLILTPRGGISGKDYWEVTLRHVKGMPEEFCLPSGFGILGNHPRGAGDSGWREDFWASSWNCHPCNWFPGKGKKSVWHEVYYTDIPEDSLWAKLWENLFSKRDGYLKSAWTPTEQFKDHKQKVLEGSESRPQTVTHTLFSWRLLQHKSILQRNYSITLNRCAPERLSKRVNWVYYSYLLILFKGYICPCWWIYKE